MSDIHGNLEAFQAVLARIQPIRADRIISLGDVIGYGPDPEAVMTLITAHDIPSVMGNHEMALCRPGTARWFNPTSRKAIAHTAAHLSRDALYRIRRFPRFLVQENLRFVHGVPPASVFLYLFQLSDKQLASRFVTLKEQICFVGHTHDLGMITWDGHRIAHESLQPGTVRLDPDKKYIITAGSVGQPRDGTPQAKYLFLDTRTLELRVDAVTYPVIITQKKIRAAGIPDIYAQKLSMTFGR